MNPHAIKINIGCGSAPTPGWKNYDNSPSVKLAKSPLKRLMLRSLGLLNAEQLKFIAMAKAADIHFVNACSKIPEAHGSVEVIYSSHMLEHLDREKAAKFLREAFRVLAPGGIIRIAVPDISYHVNNYLTHRDANRFIEDTFLTRPGHKNLFEKLIYLLIGDRHHLWMYDGPSLCKLLVGSGFSDAKELAEGTTRIADPGALDLRERSPESVFVEAIKG